MTDMHEGEMSWLDSSAWLWDVFLVAMHLKTLLSYPWVAPFFLFLTRNCWQQEQRGTSSVTRSWFLKGDPSSDISKCQVKCHRFLVYRRQTSSEPISPKHCNYHGWVMQQAEVLLVNRHGRQPTAWDPRGLTNSSLSKKVSEGLFKFHFLKHFTTFYCSFYYTRLMWTLARFQQNPFSEGFCNQWNHYCSGFYFSSDWFLYFENSLLRFNFFWGGINTNAKFAN